LIETPGPQAAFIHFSICIPQYNRIKFLLHSLKTIEAQPYPHVEVIISDDCSTDETESAIVDLQPGYKYPLRYYRHEKNMGYDKNLRTAIELATGDYVIIIGNDDSINPEYDLLQLNQFLKSNDYPEVGYTSYVDSANSRIEYRATETQLLGHGPGVALRYFSRFSFVGGLVFKRAFYLQHNTSKFDGSVYNQMYHASLMISSGGELFSIREPVVLKDILPLELERSSYTDIIARKWKDLKIVNGGLHAVIKVLIASFQDAGVWSRHISYAVFKKIYFSTFSYWILEYRKNKALPEAVGFVVGMYPGRINEFSTLGFLDKIKIRILYSTTAFSALLIPVSWFEKMKTRLWHWINK
jgi:glycosyltransferase involved in cell wall biosynthesis